MQIEIWYESTIKDSHIAEPKKIEDKFAIGRLNDPSAEISKFFEGSLLGLVIEDNGIHFKYDPNLDKLYCIALFTCKTKPSQPQLDALIKETSDQVDRGYYGEDGWFVDIGNNSYYIDLVDHDLIESQPASVVLRENV
ncbi:hypothetical protein F7R01_15945 [Pseudomonas argentinensis]|uniref:Uncharacterized protein n=1 Tax=Phytopseudomonas argentinensis TaxID=289370 RepID=A0A1I3GSZ2_9GAMM|nr:hypothetical protein [Pseudomonas argentinensis]KAB0548918.1 hypothetical protein F7R01_15945 [Pseudomonas argentinensis]SFI26461.1 hypothetical protein SAMN05216602_0329 [Pseudomonas argentinensis]